MKTARMWFWLGTVSLAGSMGAVGALAQDSRATESAVLALENVWLQSYRTNNPNLIAPELADKFIYMLRTARSVRKPAFCWTPRRSSSLDPTTKT